MAAADHNMRPECAKEFGELKQGLRTANEFRIEFRHELSDIKKRIDDLQRSTSINATEVRDLLKGHIGESTGRDRRLEAVEAAIEKLDNRAWTERATSGGIGAGVVIAVEWGLRMLM